MQNVATINRARRNHRMVALAKSTSGHCTAVSYQAKITTVVLGMIPHHEGAVVMAEIVLEHGTDPEVANLAREIIAAQNEEIDWMRAWLAERGQ